jgi:thiol-disulfide isomerase/thioredoxin
LKKIDLFNLPYTRSVLISVLVFVAAGTGYYAYCVFLKPKPAPIEGYDVGNNFIDLEIPVISGDSINISDFKGDLIILDFMAPWCPPCKEQIKVFQQISGIKKVSIISVNIDPRYDMNSLKEIANDEGVTWYYGHLPEAALEYKVSAIPVVVVIDQIGVIRYRGFFTPLESLQQLINQYL